MTKDQISAFISAAVADGWTLQASMAPDSGVPAEVAGALEKDGLHINYMLAEKPIEAMVRGPSGLQPRTMPAQLWMEGVNAKGWHMKLPAVYDAAKVQAAADAAEPPA